MTGPVTGNSRFMHVRVIVDVVVDVSHLEFIEALSASSNSHAADVVSSEIVSNLESVPYVESVVTTESQSRGGSR